MEQKTKKVSVIFEESKKNNNSELDITINVRLNSSSDKKIEHQSFNILNEANDEEKLIIEEKLNDLNSIFKTISLRKIEEKDQQHEDKNK